MTRARTGQNGRTASSSSGSSSCISAAPKIHSEQLDLISGLEIFILQSLLLCVFLELIA